MKCVCIVSIVLARRWDGNVCGGDELCVINGKQDGSESTHGRVHCSPPECYFIFKVGRPRGATHTPIIYNIHLSRATIIRADYCGWGFGCSEYCGCHRGWRSGNHDDEDASQGAWEDERMENIVWYAFWIWSINIYWHLLAIKNLF